MSSLLLSPFIMMQMYLAQEKETSTDQRPEPSPAPVPEETLPSSPFMEPEQPIQESSTAPALDLNED